MSSNLAPASTSRLPMSNKPSSKPTSGDSLLSGTRSIKRPYHDQASGELIDFYIKEKVLIYWRNRQSGHASSEKASGRLWSRHPFNL